jgi:hypothetical protein
VDSAGNESSAAELSWVIDFTAPEIAWGAFTPSASSHINSATLSADVTSSEPTTFSWLLNNLGLIGSGATVALQNLDEGDYELSVSGTDAAQNASNELVHSFAVDLTAPIASLQADVSGKTRRSDNRLTFSADEDASFECQVDGAGFSSCSSPFLVSGLAEGSHHFDVRATDLAGNVGDVVGVDWEVDLTAPVTTLVPHQSSNAAMSFEFTASEADSTFQCSLDGAALSACTSQKTYTGLAVGSHSFVVKATDSAGNAEASGATYSWTVYPPINTTISSSTPSTSITNATSMNVIFTSNTGGATFVCSWDGGAEEPCTSPASRSGLADGSHSFKVWAVDSWGTRDSVGATRSWTVDTVPPTITNLTASVTSTSMTITWQTNKPATSKLNWGQGTSTSRVVNEDSSYVTSHSIRVLGLLPNTVYSYQVSGHSQAGNAYTSTVKQTRTSP